MKRLRSKKVLVTGGCGFIGSHIVRRLVEIGAKVFVIDDLSHAGILNIKDILSKIKFFKVNIKNYKKLKNVFSEYRFDFISHQAALRSVPESLEYPEEYLKVNVKGTLYLLELARKHKVKKFVFASSSSVYGEKEKFPSKESDLPEPVSVYALSKLTGENLCYTFYKNFGLRTVSLRYFNVYGPYQSLESEYACVIPRFITCILKKKNLPVYGNGKQMRDFIFVSEVVTANLLSFLSPKADGQIFNVGQGKSYSILELIDLLKKVSKFEKIKFLFLPKRSGDVFCTKASIKKINSLLGFKPKMSFKKGLKITFDWFEKNTWFWE